LSIKEAVSRADHHQNDQFLIKTFFFHSLEELYFLNIKNMKFSAAIIALSQAASGKNKENL